VTYADVSRTFQWRVPDRYNIAADTIDRHAAKRPDAPALVYEEKPGNVKQLSFKDVRDASNRLANALGAQGLVFGDRIAILLPQAPETAIAHVAAYKSALIAVPLFVLFGPEAIEYRLVDSGSVALITDLRNWPKVAEIRDRLPALVTVIVVGGRGIDKTLDFDELIRSASPDFVTVNTAAEDPATIIYTSGTTGPPKGALHAHRFLLGHIPGVLLPHDFPPRVGDLFWTPADWAWIGGLYDVLFPAWHWGVPVLASRARRFDPSQVLDVMDRHRVRNVFMPPTALKLIRQSGTMPGSGLQLRSLASGGETLGGELLEWGRATFGLTINEFYGQTECNLVVANCSEIMEVRPGSMGRAVPGHRVAIIDDGGAVLAAGKVGAIAVKRPDPVMFLRYWNRPDETAAKFRGKWLVTGDLGSIDDDGYVWYQARDDDVITSGAYRIGPGEIEDCLLRHPAVAMAGVVGIEDPIRTQVVKAFIVLRAGSVKSQGLTNELQDLVKDRLGAHEYPRVIEYVDALPLTPTGKIIRRELRAMG